MDFKKIAAVVSLICSAGLVACSAHIAGEENGDYLIGNPTQSVAALNTPDEGQSQSLVIFDKTVRRIHQFDLTAMTHKRSFAVRNPDNEHYVLYGQSGDYIVDLSQKGLSIFNKYDQANHQP